MHRRSIAMVAASATAVGMLAAMAPASAAPQSGPKKPFVVLLEAEPALAYEGGVRGIPATAPAEGEKINARAGNVRAYQAHLKAEQSKALRQAGVTAKPANQLTLANNGFAVQLTEAEAAKLGTVRGVAMVMEDVLKQKQTDVSGEFLGLSAEGGAWLNGATGEGVVVGVIDSGIWPEHPSFEDRGLARPDGLADNIPCEFGDTAHNPLDKPFTCQNKLIGARDMRLVYKTQVGPEVYNSARDYDGHGTHTASTAAGNREVASQIFGIDRGMVSGVAPDASIIAYQGLGDLGGYGSDLAAAIDAAVADGVDVINYSVGSSSPAIGPDDISFLYAADAGVYVATSAGNAGPGASTVGSPAAVPWLTTVGASTHDRAFEATAALGNGQSVTGASITEALGRKTLVDAADRKNPLCLTDQRFVPKLRGEIVLCERGVIARVDKSKAVMDSGGSGMILFNTNDAQALVTDNHFIPSLHVTFSDGMKVRQYIESARPGKGGNRPPGTPRPVSFATASLTQGTAVATAGSVMADFSSRGPVASPGVAEIIRPDVTAPGVNVLAGNTPTPGSGRPGQLFQSISGTSMSSPHVAGLFALIKEVNPQWSAAAAKSALMTTARQDVVKEDGATPADPFDFGAGHVAPGALESKNSMFDPGVVYEAGFLDYLAYLCGTSSLVGAGTCSALSGSGYSTQAADLNVPSIGVADVAGSRTVTRTITNVSDETLVLTAEFDQPAGFSVTAEPAVVTLAPGESEDVGLTFENVTADPGSWVFGSLTWTGNGYAARSPIAVMGTQLATPAQVTQTSASGSGSVDVTFGYSGAYAVHAYGLAPQVSTTGQVQQDPDQTFAPGDAGQGATVHEVALTGTAFWRLEMLESDVPNSNVDLDIFVLGPDGSVVGSSGAGGTNELVELTNPVDGTYRVYVHGWSTAGLPSVDYTFRTWDVAAPADGGSLQVTAHPASAVQGTTGSVEYAWSGAASGTVELGLLMHQDADGEIGRTLVSVTAP